MRRSLLSLAALTVFGGALAFGGLTLLASWGALSAPAPWENATAQEAWARAYAQLDQSAAAEFPWETSAQGASCEAVLYYRSNSADRYVADTNLCIRFGGGARGVKMVYGEREDDSERRARLYDFSAPAPPTPTASPPTASSPSVSPPSPIIPPPSMATSTLPRM